MCRPYLFLCTILIRLLSSLTSSSKPGVLTLGEATSSTACISFCYRCCSISPCKAMKAEIGSLRGQNEALSNYRPANQQDIILLHDFARKRDNKVNNRNSDLALQMWNPDQKHYTLSSSSPSQSTLASPPETQALLPTSLQSIRHTSFARIVVKLLPQPCIAIDKRGAPRITACGMLPLSPNVRPRREALCLSPQHLA